MTLTIPGDPLPAGTVLRGGVDKYEILGPVGKGGSGQAYRARPFHPTSGQADVVVKIPILSSTLSYEEKRAQNQKLNASLERELSLKRKLQKLDCVAQILDAGAFEICLDQDEEVMGRADFAVQQLIDGDRLDEYVSRHYPSEDGRFAGIPKAEKFFEVALKIARSLKRIHEEQIVHGDVWYKNVIINEHGQAVFIDFGKSALHSLNLQAHPFDMVEGHYQPPEGRGSVKSDIYDFGGILCYLATGIEKPPAHVKDIDDVKGLIASVVKDNNTSLYDDNSAIVDAIARCRRYYQHERFHTVEAVIQDLEMFCNSPDLDTSALSEPPPILNRFGQSNKSLFARFAKGPSGNN